jgi:hypothetical protein
MGTSTEPFDSYPHPIKLILADLDGTVTADDLGPLDCEDLRGLRRLNEFSRTDPTVPPISLITGRPHSYLEAFARFLSTPLPSLFESGCGMHLPDERLGHEYAFHPALADPEILALVNRFRAWAEEELAAKRGAGVILGKRYSVSIATAGCCPVEELQALVENVPGDLAGKFFVTRSIDVVDVTPRPVNKGVGLDWLLERLRADGLDVGTENVLGIGDSFNDLPFLSKVGLSCAVGTGAEKIKRAVAYVTAAGPGDAVAEVAELARGLNRRLTSK